MPVQTRSMMGPPVREIVNEAMQIETSSQQLTQIEPVSEPPQTPTIDERIKTESTSGSNPVPARETAQQPGSHTIRLLRPLASMTTTQANPLARSRAIQGVWLTTSHTNQQPEQRVDGRNVKEVRASTYLLKVYGVWATNNRQLLGSMVIMLPLENVILLGQHNPPPMLNRTISFAVARAILRKELNVPGEGLEGISFDINRGQLKIAWFRGEELELSKTVVRNDKRIHLLKFVRDRKAYDILEADVELHWKVKQEELD